LPVIDVEVDALDRVSRTIKRTMDVILSVMVVLALLPLELLAAAAILVESGRPVFFKQLRVGKNGRRFTVYKFRTMTQNAESRLEGLKTQSDLTDSAGRMFKMRKDPRVTRVGAVLRKLSLDEFPQFLNVLRGEMSVVGPRPPLPEEVERYEREHLYRLRALPGITGLWQVSGRSKLSFEDMVRLDRYYLDNWSLGLDLSIIVKTIPVVFLGRGAY
jgi:exopolysaccharide biosynthesis polyprenyl glycosylphosphotransferase